MPWFPPKANVDLFGNANRFSLPKNSKLQHCPFFSFLFNNDYEHSQKLAWCPHRHTRTRRRHNNNNGSSASRDSENYCNRRPGHERTKIRTTKYTTQTKIFLKNHYRKISSRNFCTRLLERERKRDGVKECPF